MKTTKKHVTGRVRKSIKDPTLPRKVLSTLLALGFAANPLAGIAASTTTITDADGKPLTSATGPHNIYIQKMLSGNKTGVNRFKEYKIGEGDVANMYFRAKGDNVWADNLVNLVGSRIEVSGVVNAVKNDKIGGNLFFLSSQGMAVSKGGVINAGSLTAITTQNDPLERYKNATDTDLQQIVDHTDEIPLNPSGTITVMGTINATDGVHLRAGKYVGVGVEKNADGTETIEKTALVHTGVEDFSQFVNTSAVDAGLGTSLTAKMKADSGDIVLEAVSVADPSRNMTAEAEVAVGGKVEAKGDATLKATSEAVFKDSTLLNTVGDLAKGKIESKLGLAIDGDGANADGSARVVVKKEAEVKGSDVTAKAESTVKVTVGSHANDKDGTKASDTLPAAAVTYASVDNVAEVNIDGKLEATGDSGTTDVSAKADTMIASTAEADTKVDNFGKKADEKQATANAFYLAGSLVAGDTNASVNLGEGSSVIAKGDVNISSTAESSLKSTAEAKAPDGTSLSTAVNIVDYDSAAKTNIDGAVSGANVTVKADNVFTKNVITASNGAGTGDTTPGPHSRSFQNSKTAQVLMGSDDKSVSNLITGKVAGILPKKLGKLITDKTLDDGKSSFASNLTKYVKAGASVAVADETNSADVKIGKTGTINAARKADVAANTEMKQLQVSVDGTVNNQNKENSESKVMAGIGFAYSDVDNTANVTTEGDSTKAAPQIQGTSVSVTAKAKNDLNVETLIKNIDEHWSDITAGLDELEKSITDDTVKTELTQEKTDIITAIKNLKTALSVKNALTADTTNSTTDSFENMQEATKAILTAFDTLTSSLNAVNTTLAKTTEASTDTGLGVKKLVDDLKSLASLNSYVNYYARTTMKDKDAGSDTGSTLGASGALNLAHLDNKAAVLIGQGSSLKATSGDVDVKADANTTTISFTGNAEEYFKPNSAAGSSVGASLAVQDINSNSLVMVGKDTSLEGTNVNVKADEYMNEVGIIYGAGESGGTAALSGMVSIISGDGDSVVSVDDEAALTASKDVNLRGENSTYVTNVAGGATIGSGNTAVAAGVGVALSNVNVNNIVSVGDNGSGANVAEVEISDSDTEAETLRKKSANKEAKAVKLAQDMAGTEGMTLMGNATAEGTTLKGVSANNVDLSAETKGVINSIGAEGAVTTADGDDKSPGALTKLKNALGKPIDFIGDKVGTAAAAIFDKVDNTVAGKIADKTGYDMNKLANSGTNAQNGETNGTAVTDGKTLADPTPETTNSTVRLDAAGSGALNFSDGQTAVLADGAKFNLTKDTSGTADKNGDLTAKAADGLFTGAWAGAAAVNWSGKTANGTDKAVAGLGGALAYNDVDRDVASVIKDSTISGASDVKNTAEKNGVLFAAGLGFSLTKGSSQGATVGGAASVSYNNADTDVHALMVDDTVDGGNISTYAHNQDLQVTGGLSTSIMASGNGGASIGGTAAISDIDNNLMSGLVGGTYTGVDNVNVNAVTNTKQIGAAAAIGISASQKSTALSGAVNYGSLTNNNDALIDGSTITTTDAGKVTVSAGDEIRTDDQGNTVSNSYETYISDRGVDVSGATGSDEELESAYGNAGKAATTGKIPSSSSGNTKNLDKGGSLIVNAAVSVAGAGSSSPAVGAAVNVTNVENNITSRISGANITASEVTGKADATTKIISTAGGVGGGKYGGAGSVNWNTLDNDTTVTMEKSAITSPKLTEKATNESLIIGAAGQVSAGQAGVGMALSYNGITNTTGAYANGLTLQNKDDGETALELKAKNTGLVMAATAGVSGASEAALSGSIAMNRGSNDTEAVVGNTGDRSTLTNISSLTVEAEDSTTDIAAAGSITGSGNTAVGGAVAYNDIGGFTSGSKQKTRAEVNHADITMTGNDPVALVHAKDKSTMATVAVGIGGSGTVAVQGAVAVSNVAKDVSAGMNDSNVDKDKGTGTANVGVAAESESTIGSNATVAAGSGTAAVGAGLSVNRIKQDTEASIAGGTHKTKDEMVLADSDATIIATGIGGSGSGTVAVAGSFGINMIGNDTKAAVSGATLTSDGSVGVIAESDDKIANYAGSVSGAGTAAIGLASAVNSINGSTEATVENSTINAAGNDGGVDTKGDASSGLITDQLTDTSKWNAKALEKAREEKAYSGVVVDASSTHSISSVMMSAGGSGVAAVAGTMNTNTVTGSTKAAVTNTDLNKDLTDLSSADIHVGASDYTNSAGFVGSVGGSGVASVGAALDTNVVSRTTEASVTGKSGRNTAKANELDVTAKAGQALSNFDVNAQLAAAVSGGAAVGGTFTTDVLRSQTKASLANMNVTYTDSAKVNASHQDLVLAGNNSTALAGLGAGVGLSTGVVTQGSKVAASVSNSSVTSDNTDSTIDVKAENSSKLKTIITSMGAAAVGVAGSTAVNNMSQDVSTTVSGSTLKAGNINVSALNNTSVLANAGAASGGIGGAGISTVINTFSDKVNTNVTGSTLTSTKDDVTISSENTRDVDGYVVSANAGGIEAGANFMVTVVNNGVNSTTTGTTEEGMPEDPDTATETEKRISQANDAASKGDRSSSILGLSAAEQKKIRDSRGVADDGSTASTASGVGVHTAVTGSTISSADDVAVTSVEKSDTKLNSYQGTAAAAAVNGTVGVMNVRHSTGTTVDNSTISSDGHINVTATQGDLDKTDDNGNTIKGKGTQLDLYQGTAGGFAAAAAYGRIDTSGETGVTVSNGSTLTSSYDTNVTAMDTGSTTVKAYGLTAGLGAVGAIMVQADNESDTAVTVDNSTMDTKNAVIGSAKVNTVTAEAHGGAFGTGGALNGVIATASDNGSSKTTLRGRVIADDDMTIVAEGAPKVEAKALGFSGALLGAAGASVARAQANGTVELSIADGSTLASGDSMDLFAAIGPSEDVGESYVKAKALGNAVAIGGSLGINTAKAAQDSTVTVNAGKATYIADELTINGSSSTLLDADTEGLNIGFITSGTNLATAEGNLKTTINANGTADGSSLGTVTIAASGVGDVDNNADGSGGGAFGFNPYAAKTETTLKTDTQTNVSGDWNASSFSASAVNRDDIVANADAMAAAVAGYSGTQMKTTVDHKANVNVSGKVTTTGAQQYNAENAVDHDVTLKGSGYGVVTGNAADMTSDLKYQAAVNLNGAKLTSDGTLDATADTTGSMDYMNELKSAGAVPVAVAHTKNTLSYDNGVSLTNGADLKTTKADQDINLTANDDTVVSVETVADTQGGAIGVATAKTESTLNRKNTINVSGNSKLESSNDANLYAGADQDHSSKLIYTVLADSYNRTVLPVKNSPTVKDTMTQANQVNVDGSVRSVRHANLKAGRGVTNVAESAQTYNIYTGNGGKGDVGSTVLGSPIKSEKTDNKIDISGSVESGIHGSLDLTIEGNVGTRQVTGYDEEQKKNVTITDLDYSGIQVTTGAGQDWFDTSKVSKGVIDIKNTLMDRYNAIVNVMATYPKGSNEYAVYENEKNMLIQKMIDYGFYVVDSKGNKATLDKVLVVAVTLPDIVVSGGNVNLDSDKVTGNGRIHAGGVQNLSVTNNTSLYLKANDLVVKDNGGSILQNDSVVTSKDNLKGGFAGTLESSNVNGTSPKMTLAANGQTDQKVKIDTGTVQLRPDIGLYGKKVQNSLGDLTVTNAHGNIYVDQNTSVNAANITLQASNGTVEQTSNGWIAVGDDPVSLYMLSDSIAKKIQEYITKNVTLDDQGNTQDETGLHPGIGIFGGNKLNSLEDYQRNLLALADKIGFTEDEKTLIRNVSRNESKGINAGKNIYISGKDVILDGLVQSGYAKYNVNDLDVDKIASLDSDYENGRLRDSGVTDKNIFSYENYRVSNQNAVYNSDTKLWEGSVAVYYNPATKKLLTSDLETGGGNIYITGNMASTSGQGRIIAMDGTPDITIDTTGADKDLVVNGIRNQRQAGYISIKDTKANKLTEIKRNGSNLTVKETPLTKGASSTSKTVSGLSYDYNPAAQTLKWTGGSSGDVTVKQYEQKEEKNWWGLHRTDLTDEWMTAHATEVGNAQATSELTKHSGDLLGSETVLADGHQKYGYNTYSDIKKDGEEVRTGHTTSTHRHGFMWSKVTITHKWIGTQNTSTATTYSIQADKAIQTGINTSGSDKIAITGKGNVTMAGNVANEGTKGSVSITSQNGAIDSYEDVHMNTDKLTARAAKGIDLTHSAISDAATIDLSSSTGDVKLTSDKGNITFTQANAASGNLNLTTAGNMTTGSNGVLSGNRVDLTSRTGTINAEVKTAAAPINSDSMSASLNATAYGNITLSNANDGTNNMRVGHIESTNGDVTLKTSGSFEDAVGNSKLSGTMDKMALWEDMGLVKDTDANARSEAAEAARQERVDALSARAEQLSKGDADKKAAYAAEAQSYTADAGIKKAKETYQKAVQAAGDDTAVTNAYNAYKAAQDAYFKDKGYSEEEQDFIIASSEVNNSTDYGWSRNNLLYAIQEGVLNSSPRDEVVLVDTPNIKAKNITLNAGKNIGVDGEAMNISYDDINQVDNLKILADAKAGDLTWGDNALTVKKQIPLTVQIEDGGKLNLNANTSKSSDSGNIYLAGVKDTKLDVSGSISTDKDVKLLSDKGLSMTEGGIEARNLTVTGGKGDIGSEAHNLNTNITGSLDAHTAGNIYVHQTALKTGDTVNPLTLQSLAGHEVNISADKGMKMTTETGKTMGYVDGDLINLSAADGNIGVKDDGIRIKNNGAVVNVDAEKGSAYLAGKQGSSLTLKEGKAKGDFVITSEGTVDLGKAAEDGKEAITGTLTADNITIDANVVNQNVGTVEAKGTGTDGTATLKAKTTVNINDGTISANKANLEATTGALNLNKGTLTATESAALKAGTQIIQNAVHQIITPMLSAEAVNGISLKSGADETTNKLYNDLGTVNVKNTTDGDVTIGNGGNGGLTVNMAEGSTAANLTLHNYKDGTPTDMTVTGKALATNQVSILNDEGSVNASAADGKVVNITSTGDIHTTDAINGETVTETANGSIANDNTVTSTVGDTKMTATNGSITNANAVSSAADTKMEAKTTIENKSSVASTNATTLKAGTSISNTGNVSSTNGNTSMNAGTSITNSGAVSSTNGNTTMNAGTDITNNSDVSGKNVTMESTSGNITNGTAGGTSTVRSTEGDISLKATAGSITNNSSVSSAANTEMNAATTIENKSTVASTGDTTMKAGTTLTNEGNVEGSEVTMTSKDELLNKGTVTSKTGDTTIRSTDSSVTNEKAITSEVNTVINAATGITNSGDVTSKTGNTSMKAGTDIKNTGKLTSGVNTDLTAMTGSITNSGDVTSQTGVTTMGAGKDISNTGNLTSGKETKLTAGENITNDGSVGASDISMDAGKNIDNNGSLTAGDGDVSLVAKNDISQDGKVTATENVSMDSTTKGNVSISTGVDAGKDITITTNDGSILFEGKDPSKTEDIHVTSKNGNIKVESHGVGDIKDTHRKANGDRAFLDAQKGNVNVSDLGKGIVDLYHLYADADMIIHVADGDLYLHEVEGELVGLFVKNPDKEMDVENIKAGTEIAVVGDSIGIGNITQRLGRDGNLIITPDSATGTDPIDNLDIRNISTNKGVEFSHLWLKNGNITVSKGNFNIDKLYIEDKATFSNSVMTTDVFGTAPVYDKDISSAYWINTSINSPRNNLTAWNDRSAVNTPWMYLNFRDRSNIQKSNGNLLHLKDYFYVYSQRYSATDWMDLYEMEDRYDFYRKYYHPSLTYSERYNLIDTSKLY